MYEDCPGCPYKTYKKFYDYYGDYDYADKWVMAALEGKTYIPANAGTTHAPGGAFGAMTDAARQEAVQKGTAYQNVWMYVIREVEDAIDDCKLCTKNCNECADSVNKAGQYNAVHAWDEGVAFYTGSLAGTTAGHKSKGQLVFALAEKRCENYGTCHIRGGLSQVNTELFKLFAQGRDKLHYSGSSTCDDARPILDDIIRLMTVPLVQGTLRYAYKVGHMNGVDNDKSDQTAKNHAEGAPFAQALLPLLHHCDAAAAKVVSDNMKFNGQTFATDSGITCAQVGQLLLTDNTPADGVIKAGMEACTHKAYIAGYNPGSSVTQHNQIDLDQKALQDAIATKNADKSVRVADFRAAKTIYTSGGTSETNDCGAGVMKNSCSKGSARTLQGFSTKAKKVMYEDCPGCPYKTYKKFYDYYGDYDYADKWVMAALEGKTYIPANAGTTHAPGGAFGAMTDAARQEAVQKGTAYQNVWMYVIREFEDAIDDCKLCTKNCNEFSDSVTKAGQYNAVHAWDEGVAFYTGSLAGTTAGHKSKGQLVFALAEKRCENYGTCHIRGGLSQVNTELFKLFAQGRDKLHY